MRIASLLLWLFASAVALAEVRIEGDLKIDQHKIVRLRAAGDVAGAALIWDVSDEEKIDSEDQPKTGRFLFAAPPGTYRVKLRAIRIDKEGLPIVETARATVVIGDGKPIPPNPPPGPPTPPTPPDPKPGPNVDLVGKFKATIAADITAMMGTKNDAAMLGDVYTSSANILEQIADPAVAPKSVEELYQKLFLASIAKNIPRYPFLKTTRDLIEAQTGKFSPSTPITQTLKAELVSKLRLIGGALEEAAK